MPSSSASPGSLELLCARLLCQLPVGLCWWQGVLCAPVGPGSLAPRPGPPLPSGCQLLRGCRIGDACSAGVTVSAVWMSPLLSLSFQPGDRKLAQSAQMYHYQHQKQQMLSMDKCVLPCGDGLQALQEGWAPLPSSCFSGRPGTPLCKAGTPARFCLHGCLSAGGLLNRLAVLKRVS